MKHPLNKKERNKIKEKKYSKDCKNNSEFKKIKRVKEKKCNKNSYLLYVEDED